MSWWWAGLALAALLALAAWDVGRPGRASRPALLVMRAVGGLALVAMAANALAAGSREAAIVAAAGAAPLVAGVFPRALQSRAERARTRAPAPAPAPARERAPAEERRAA